MMTYFKLNGFLFSIHFGPICSTNAVYNPKITVIGIGEPNSGHESSTGSENFKIIIFNIRKTLFNKINY